MPPGRLRSSVPVLHRIWLCICSFGVALCVVHVSAQDQTPQIYAADGSQPAPGASPSEIVAIAAEGDVAALDAYDTTRYVRIPRQTASIVYSLEQTVSRVTLVVYFHRDTEEQVTLIDGDRQSALKSQGTEARISDSDSVCEDTAVQNRGELDVCVLRDTEWFRVTWSPTLTQCAKDVIIRLEGNSTDDVVSVGDITIFGPDSNCKEKVTALSTGIIAAVIAGAVVLLIIIGICCWQCLKPKNDPAPYGGPYGGPDDPFNPNHPINQAVHPTEDGHGMYGQSSPQRPSAHHTHAQHQQNYQNGYQVQSNPAHPQSSVYASPAADYANNAWSSPAPAAPSYSVSQPAQQQLAEQIPEPSYSTKQTSAAVSNNNQVPEAVKYSQSVTSTTAPAQQPAENNLVSIPAATRHASKQAPQAEQMTQSDDDEVDQVAGPMYDEAQEEPPDPQQNAMLKDIHLQQAAGITEMIQGVKDNLMQMQTLKNRDGQADAGLEIFNKIGGGGFGEVFKGKYKGKDVAVKIMKIKPGAKQESLTELPYTEAAIAGICIHANIVQTMYSDLMPVLDSSSAQEGGGSFWSKAKDERVSRSLVRSDSSVKEWQVRMVMEICDLGSVRDWVSPAAGHKYGALYAALPTKAGTQGCGSRTLCALLTSLDVANGMKLLHKYKILHSDLKPHNVLLCSSHTDPRGFIAKLSDFGLSMKMAAHDGQVPGIKYGTVQYLAPEVLNTHIMTKKADVYSFGIIMWEVWHSRLFAEFYNNEKRKRKTTGQSMEDYRPMVSSKCPKSFVQLMTMCLDRTAEKRPDFLGGNVNICVELERLIHEEYQKMASGAAAAAAAR